LAKVAIFATKFHTKKRI